MKRLLMLVLGVGILQAWGCTNFNFKAHHMKCSATKPCVEGFRCVGGVCVASDKDVQVLADAADTDVHDAKNAVDIGRDADLAMDVHPGDVHNDMHGADVRKCGNGVCDRGEDCASCPADCGCADGAVCENGVCTQVIEDARDSTQADDGVAGQDVPKDVSGDEGTGMMCGNGVCDPGEDCASCPVDCGCADGAVCKNGVCTQVIEDARDSTQADDGVAGQDVPKDVPGDDGTGMICGNGVCDPGENCDSCPQDCGCTAGQLCYQGSCCTPKTCADMGYECGQHQGNCGKTLKCGICTQHANSYCDANGKCGCHADCTGKECGDDGCGGSCGVCPANEECNHGQCTCLDDKPRCNGVCCPKGDICYGQGCCTPKSCEEQGFECGQQSDGCGSNIDCGKCDEFANSYCDAGKCKCTPACDNKECGDDGCGHSCGECQPPLECSAGRCKCPKTHVCGDSCCFTGDYCFKEACQVPAIPVVPTGQDTCVSSASVIGCPGTAGSTECGTLSYCGQDAQYPDLDRHWIVQGDGEEKMVIDSATGVVYQMAAVEKPDYQHAAAYCESLIYAGHSDWVLPSLFELLNMMDYGKNLPAIDTSIFQTQQSMSTGMFGSATPVYGQSSRHWAVNIIDGTDFPMDDAGSTQHYFVRCVRSTIGRQPDNRFLTLHTESNTKKAILDQATGLIWNTKTGTGLNWRAALSYCEQLECCNNSDWRLPNVNELRSLLDMTKKNPATKFPGFTTAIYWTATHSGNATTIYKIDFSTGRVALSPQTDTLNVICVRGGTILK